MITVVRRGVSSPEASAATNASNKAETRSVERTRPEQKNDSVEIRQNRLLEVRQNRLLGAGNTDNSRETQKASTSIGSKPQVLVAPRSIQQKPDSKPQVLAAPRSIQQKPGSKPQVLVAPRSIQQNPVQQNSDAPNDASETSTPPVLNAGNTETPPPANQNTTPGNLFQNALSNPNDAPPAIPPQTPEQAAVETQNNESANPIVPLQSALGENNPLSKALQSVLPEPLKEAAKAASPAEKETPKEDGPKGLLGGLMKSILGGGDDDKKKPDDAKPASESQVKALNGQLQKAMAENQQLTQKIQELSGNRRPDPSKAVDSPPPTHLGKYKLNPMQSQALDQADRILGLKPSSGVAGGASSVATLGNSLGGNLLKQGTGSGIVGMNVLNAASAGDTASFIQELYKNVAASFNSSATQLLGLTG